MSTTQEVRSANVAGLVEKKTTKNGKAPAKHYLWQVKHADYLSICEEFGISLAEDDVEVGRTVYRAARICNILSALDFVKYSELLAKQDNADLKEQK